MNEQKVMRIGELRKRNRRTIFTKGVKPYLVLVLVVFIFSFFPLNLLCSFSTGIKIMVRAIQIIIVTILVDSRKKFGIKKTVSPKHDIRIIHNIATYNIIVFFSLFILTYKLIFSII